MKNSTILKRLLTFVLPITILPLLLIMLFYYIYTQKVIQNEIIYFQEKILNHIIDDVNEHIDKPSKLKHHIYHDHIALPETTVFDKDMNILVNNFGIKNSYEAYQKYNKEILEGHFKKILESKSSEIIHDKKNSLLIKPMIRDDKVIAYVTSGYRGTVNEKMRAINQTFLYLLFLIIFTLFIISIFVIVFSLKLLHPLELLIDGIKKIAAGDLSCNINNTSNDEFGIVVDAFNEMTLKRKLVEEELIDLATRDGLTGLYNHKFFYTTLEKEIIRADRYNDEISMLLIDIDYFKKVNDTYGHRAGDTILKSLSQRLSTRSRTTDTLCRYGGEEITMILVKTNITDAQVIAEEIRLLIEKEPFVIEDGTPISITVSIGVSTYSERAKEASVIVSNADDALYKAKENGRNRVCIL